jgi:hypothetical protein
MARQFRSASSITGVHRYGGKGEERAGGHGRWRSIPIGEVADVSIKKLPEMIRNDNGQLAGYIYVDIEA